MSKENKISIVLVDDHPVVIEGLQMLLAKHDGIEVVASLTNGTSLIDHLQTNRPDVVLLDLTLPDIDGIELSAIITQKFPPCKVLILSNHNERGLIMQALKNGASGYLLKNVSSTELAQAIEEVVEGDIVLSREIRTMVIRAMATPVDVPSLTKREKEVLQLIANGKTTVMIADQLNVSPLTIETHRRNLLQKLGAKNAPDLLMQAVKHRLLSS